jgi:hypothetical protein
VFMAADAGAIARLSRVLADGAIDARALDAREREIAELLGRSGRGPSASRSDLLVLAVNLHAYYTALETLLERIARLVDEDVPSGPTWHRDLLSQMRIDLPGLRPRAIPPELVPELDELRKFRHFFRNAYVLDLDPAKTLAHGERVMRVHPALSRDIAQLFGHLEAVRQALAHG